MSGEREAAGLCLDLRRALGGADPEVGPVLSREQTVHLAQCAACRDAVAQADPAALFSQLALETKNDAFWLGFETRVLAEIRAQEREPAGILGWLRPRKLTLAGLTAAMAVAALVLVLSVTRRQGETPKIAHGAAPAAPPELVAMASPPLLPLPQDSRAEPSPVESVTSSTARIISIRVDGEPGAAAAAAPTGAGSQRGDSDVVLIVDQRIDL